MTEPDVASSDATNIETKLTKVRQNDGTFKYILNGKKWWSTGAMDPRCKLTLVLARMDYSHPSISSTLNNNNNDDANSSNHGAHTVVVLPMSKVTMVRPLTVFGYDDAPHGHAEVAMKDIVLDESCLILGEGKGFEIAQSRLGPGRIHHCMRAVGLAARCYELMLERTLQRKTFGKYLWEHG
jgi:acyl-CoA dehydrogenase